MMKSRFGLLAFLALGSSVPASTAAAEEGHGPVRVRESAGLWTAVVTGTIENMPYVASATLVIAADGQSAIETEDGSLGAEARELRQRPALLRSGVPWCSVGEALSTQRDAVA